MKEDSFRFCGYGGCNDPNHSPGPLLVSLRPGQKYYHTCPACKKVSVIVGSHNQPTM